MKRLEIERWLESPDWQTGVELYQKYGDNLVVKALLKVKTDFAFKRLKEELSKICLQEDKTTIVQGKVTSVEDLRYKKPSELPDAPAQIRSAVAKRRNLYNEYISLHALLKEFVPLEERRKASLRILDIFDEIAPLWDLTNYYDVNLKLPEERASEVKELDNMTTEELHRQYETCYKYCRKNVSNDKLRQKCIERVETAKEIRNILETRNAFFLERLAFPTFD